MKKTRIEAHKIKVMPKQSDPEIVLLPKLIKQNKLNHRIGYTQVLELVPQLKARFHSDEGYRANFPNYWGNIKKKYLAQGLLGGAPGTYPHEPLPLDPGDLPPNHPPRPPPETETDYPPASSPTTPSSFEQEDFESDHQDSPMYGMANASLWIDCYKRSDHSPTNGTDVRHSSEDASKLCDVAVNLMLALDGLSGPVDFPPRSKEYFRGGVVIVGHRLSFGGGCGKNNVGPSLVGVR